MANEGLKFLKAKGTPAQPGGMAKILSEGERRFQASLCHEGANGNGQIYTREELKKAAANFKKNFKIRMTEGPVEGRHDPANHPKKVVEIIGRGIHLEFIDDAEGPRLEFVGEVYKTTPHADQAYEVIKDRFYEFDSVEVDYAEGECSTCHKRFVNPRDICQHLELFNGMPVGTKRGQVIMHDITITGAAMLENQGADPRAKVKAVAHLVSQEDPMPEEIKDTTPKPEGNAVTTPPAAPVPDPKLAELEQKLTDTEAKLKVYQDAERKARCESIVEAKIKRGATMTPEAKKTAIDDLMKKSDEILVEMEAFLKDVPEAKAEPAKEPEKPAEKPSAKATQNKPGEEESPLSTAGDPANTQLTTKEVVQNFLKARDGKTGEKE